MDKKRILKLDNCEHGIIVNALVDMRNELIDEKRCHDAVDEVILKVVDAPSKHDRPKGEAR